MVNHFTRHKRSFFYYSYLYDGIKNNIQKKLSTMCNKYFYGQNYEISITYIHDDNVQHFYNNLQFS